MEMLGELFDAALWTEIEACVGIFCACAPALKALAQRYVPSILDTIQTQTERKYATFGSKNADTLTDSLTPTLLYAKGTREDIELAETSHYAPKLPEIWPAQHTTTTTITSNAQMHAVLPLTESEEHLIYLKRNANDGLPLSMIKS
jgi:hypothetical protein